MKRSIFFLLILCLLFTTSIIPHSIQAETVWETLVPGIDYREYRYENPFNHVYVARMDRTVESVSLESSMSFGNISGGFETTSSQANRYQGSLNNWHWNAAAGKSDLDFWGGSNQVVVTINGGYTEKNSNGIPQSGQVHSGWYAKRFLNLVNFSGIIWKDNRDIFLGGCVTHPADKQVITFANASTMEITTINTARSDNSLILYTPQFDVRTPANTALFNDNPQATSLTEVVVEMSRPANLTLQSDNANGTVRQIRQNQGSTIIPFDAVVISASGTLSTTLLNNVQVGDTIGIAQKVKDYVENCSTTTGLPWEGGYAGVEYDFHFLQNGVVNGYLDKPTATSLAPRTAIAFNDHYVYFIVVDGRNPGNSIGMTIAQLGAFARDELQALEAGALDGGGSSTIVVNGKVMNFPSDGVYNAYWNSTPPNSLFIPLVQGGVENAVPNIVERGVPNGMMMVVVQQPNLSTKFSPGQNVAATANVNMRQGPGTNYNKLDTVSNGAQGVILAHGNGLNGVWATGYFWWKVDFSGKTGWVVENYLVKK